MAAQSYSYYACNKKTPLFSVLPSSLPPSPPSYLRQLLRNLIRLTAHTHRRASHLPSLPPSLPLLLPRHMKGHGMKRRPSIHHGKHLAHQILPSLLSSLSPSFLRRHLLSLLPSLPLSLLPSFGRRRRKSSAAPPRGGVDKGADV